MHANTHFSLVILCPKKFPQLFNINLGLLHWAKNQTQLTKYPICPTIFLLQTYCLRQHTSVVPVLGDSAGNDLLAASCDLASGGSDGGGGSTPYVVTCFFLLCFSVVHTTHKESFSAFTFTCNPLTLNDRSSCTGLAPLCLRTSS